MIYKEYLQAKELVLSGQLFDINNFIHLKNKVEIFINENPFLMKNNIVSQFLDEEYNRGIFAIALFGEKELVDLLNERFRKFYFEYRFIAYICKLLYFEAINFDRGKRKLIESEPLIVDKRIKEDSELTFSDTIFKEELEFEFKSNTLDDCIIDEQLYMTYKNLKENQRQILYLKYYTLLKDTEIAKKLNVTRQAVSKSRNKALITLRNSLREERK
ncbi:MAG: sigma factor-like helix-turn-helix DNA-binding protein [Vulcanibacillus sp.]